MISAIWAEDENGLIGKADHMPWRLPAEQQHFKQTTMNQVILMGRKTFDGMKRRVLPGRISIVLTRQSGLLSENPQVLIMHDINEVLSWYHQQEKDLFITGGAEILNLFEPHLEVLYQTVVHGAFKGDAYFPQTFDFDKFKQISSDFYDKDEKNPYAFTIRKYKRTNELK